MVLYIFSIIIIVVVIEGLWTETKRDRVEDKQTNNCIDCKQNEAQCYRDNNVDKICIIFNYYNTCVKLRNTQQENL